MSSNGNQPVEQPYESPPRGAAGEASPGPRPHSAVLARPRPTPQPRIELCPYCGRESVNTTRCGTCGGLFDALSKQATQNAMGPWWLREGDRPLRPGCSYDTVRAMVARGTITLETVLRGPTTRQFWMRARRAPGVAHLLGLCHSCQREVSPQAFMCQGCGASFTAETDRQHLGLAPIALLPGQAAAERIAAVSAVTAPLAPAKAASLSESSAMGSGGWYGAAAASGPQSIERGYLAPSTAMPSSLLPRDDNGLGADVSLARFEPIRGRRRSGFSFAGAVGLMLTGGSIAMIAIGAALVAAQGGLPEALAAIGLGDLRDRPIQVARADGASDVVGGAASGRAAPAGSVSEAGVVAAPGEGARGPAGPGQAEPGRAEPAPQEAPAIQTDPGAGDSLPAAQHAARVKEISGLLQAGGIANLRQALGEVERAERERVFGADESADWRMAIDARLDAAEMGSLP